jgi:hypothetical protein
MKIKFYSIDEINKINYNFPSIYFCPDYCKCCEFSDNYDIEYCLYKELIYVYLKKKKDDKYELISPYGYSGLFYNNENTLYEFYKLFEEECKEKKYINEIIRQNPFLLNKSIELSKIYNILNKKTLFSIKMDESENFFNNYFRNDINSKKRNMYNKAIKLNYYYFSKKLELSDINELSEFRIMYSNTMEKVNSSEYYYFNDNYFNQLANLKYTYLCWVEYENKKVGFTIIFLDNKYVHYHLSCNDQSNNCIVDFLLLKIIEEYCKNKIFILGCGVTENDNLHKFKKSLSNNIYEYIIYSKK